MYAFGVVLSLRRGRKGASASGFIQPDGQDGEKPIKLFFYMGESQVHRYSRVRFVESSNKRGALARAVVLMDENAPTTANMRSAFPVLQNAAAMKLACSSCGSLLTWNVHNTGALTAPQGGFLKTRKTPSKVIFDNDGVLKCSVCEHLVQTAPCSAKCAHCQGMQQNFDPNVWRCDNPACQYGGSCSACRACPKGKAVKCGCAKLHSGSAGQMHGANQTDVDHRGALCGLVILH